MQKVGVFAGTFDPIHEGHLAFAKQATELCGLHKVFFLVETRPRRKQGVRALEHREAMVRLAVADHDELGMIQLEQPRFNVEETLPKLIALFKGAELYFLMGEDIALHLNNWPHIEDLLESSNFILGVREGDETKISTLLDVIKKSRNITFPVEIITTEHNGMSSSQIRGTYKKGRQPVGVPSKVADYIKASKLYATSEE